MADPTGIFMKALQPDQGSGVVGIRLTQAASGVGSDGNCIPAWVRMRAGMGDQAGEPVSVRGEMVREILTVLIEA